MAAAAGRPDDAAPASAAPGPRRFPCRRQAGRPARNPRDCAWPAWSGSAGVIAFPGFFHDEGEPCRPDLLLWLHPDGAILGREVTTPGEAIALATRSLRATMEAPSWGRPHRPRRVRVADEALAVALRARHPEIVCAETPELDAVAAAMREDFTRAEANAGGIDDDDGSPAGPATWLSGDVTADAVEPLFRATAELYCQQPGQVFTGDDDVVAVSIEALDVHDAALAVMGHRDEATLRGRAFVDERVAAMKVTVGFEVPKAPSPAPVPWWLPEGVVDDDPARGAW